MNFENKLEIFEACNLIDRYATSSLEWQSRGIVEETVNKIRTAIATEEKPVASPIPKFKTVGEILNEVENGK